MSIKSDRWIRKMAREHGMIEPFEPGQVRVDAAGERIVSYGTSSYGYDVRCAREFKIFTNINSAIVDPKTFDPSSFVDVEGDTCIIPPNSFALARTVEYFRIPRNVLTICLGKSTYARCFSGDTRVALVDGRAPRLEDMARAAEAGERFFGYGMAGFGKVEVVELEAPRLIGRDALIELTLDNGKRIRATPDHEFLMRDGTMCQADDLVPGASLMPLYRALRRGYEAVWQPMTGYMTATHRLADEWNLRHGMYPDTPGTHRHHIDHCRTNNAPWNIERMDAGEHIRLHNAISYGDDFDRDEHGRAISDALSRLRRDDAWYARYREAQSARAIDFRHSERHVEVRAAQSERSRAAWESDRGERRVRQAEHARHLRRRADIDEETVRRALDETGSIRGAARALDVDRSVSRRFPDVVAAFRGRSSINHRITGIREIPGEHDVYCLTVPETGNFALEAGVFTSNCGIIVNVTPLEPEWEGHVTLEFSNTTPLPAKIYADEGIAQMLFLESDEVCETSYADRGGKYQGQRGVTLPRT